MNTTAILKSMVLLLAATTLLFSSCSKEDVPQMQRTQEVQFSFSSVSVASEGGRISEEEITPTSVIVTVANAQGETILNKEEIILYQFGESYLSAPVTLVYGDYRLKEFLVMEESIAVYATPIEGSSKAHLVDDPLPINFNVSANDITTVTPEVLRIDEDDDAVDYGYGQFGFEVVETIDMVMSVFIMGESNFELTNASMIINGLNDSEEVEWTYETGLEAKANQLEIREASYYSITVTKDGYEVWETKVEFEGTYVMEVILEKSAGEMTLKWDKYFDGQFLTDVVNTPDGGYLIGGYTTNKRAFVIRMNSDSSVRWEWEQTNNCHIRIHGVTLTSAGDIFAVGSKGFGNGADSDEGMVVKLNSSGTQQWIKYYGVSMKPDYFYSVDITRENDIVMVGSTRNTQNNISYWLIKINDEGQILLNKTYSVPFGCKGQAVKATRDGGYLIGGVGNTAPVYKLNSQGDVEWSYNFEPYKVAINDVEELSNGDFMAVGAEKEQYYANYAIRFSPEGSVKWENVYSEYSMGWTYYTFNTVKELVPGKIVMGGSLTNSNSYIGPGKLVINMIDDNGGLLHTFIVGEYIGSCTIEELTINSDSDILAVGVTSTPESYMTAYACKISLE